MNGPVWKSGLYNKHIMTINWRSS